MSSPFYAKDGKIHCSEYMELYIPSSYFEDGIAKNNGSSIETLGILYMRVFKDGTPGPIQMLNLPVRINVMLYEFQQETIRVPSGAIDVMTLQYLKDAYVLHQTVQKGREVAESFLSVMLSGKLPRTLNYDQIINMWWRNLEISGVSFKVPSKVFEMIIATIYRSPNNQKVRYGQYYGRSSSATGYEYKTGNVQAVVRDLSTFSGMVFEDISTMISNGINNSIEGVEEPVSPLEKIIHY